MKELTLTIRSTPKEIKVPKTSKMQGSQNYTFTMLE